jgi:hypothetical protein
VQRQSPLPARRPLTVPSASVRRSLCLGGIADTQTAAPAAGLELGWEIVPHLAVEGVTLWSDPGDGRHEFGVLIGPKFNLGHGQRRVPFLSLGAGLSRTTLDEGAAPVPRFYASRMADVVTPQRIFDEFVASIGGGADFYLHSHWAIRPDVRLLMVAGDSDRRWITAFGVHLAYHFEHHHIAD